MNGTQGVLGLSAYAAESKTLHVPAAVTFSGCVQRGFFIERLREQ